MRKLWIVLAALVIAALACSPGGGGAEEEEAETPTPDATNTPEGKPAVVIDAPPSLGFLTINALCAGLGDVLAEGSRRAAERFGDGSW